MGTILAIIIFCGAAYYLKQLLDDIERKQAIAKEKKRKQRVLEEARKDKNVYIWDSSKAREAINVAGGLNELEQTDKNKLEQFFNNFQKLSAKNLELFSREIKRQFNLANNRLERAELLINDELSKIRSFQKKIYDTTIIEYENIIQPFKQSLSTSSSYKSVSVSAVSDYTLPTEFAPDNLRKNLDVQLSTLNKSLMKISGEFGQKFRDNKNKLSKEEAMVVAVQAVITSGLFYLGRAEKHKTLQKIGEEVCEYCLNKEGVISSYGRTQSIIQRKYKMIERMIDSVNKLLPQVRIIIEQGKSFQQLNSHEIKITKDLYFYGEDLKRLLTTDIFR